MGRTGGREAGDGKRKGGNRGGKGLGKGGSQIPFLNGAGSLSLKMMARMPLLKFGHCIAYVTGFKSTHGQTGCDYLVGTTVFCRFFLW